MFIDFSFSNYRSFKDNESFTMLAAPLRANDAGLEEEHVFNIAGIRLLKTKAVYGQNASGKSNIIKAIELFCNLVSRSVLGERLTQPAWNNRFGLLLNWDDVPMMFQLVFLHQGTIYRYGFGIRDGIIDAEWLFGRPNKQEVKFFHRSSDGIEINENNFKGAQPFADFLMEGHEIFRNDSLFLTGAALMGNKQAKSIRETIAKINIVDGLDDKEPSLFSKMALDKGPEHLKNALRGLVEAADSSIRKLEIIELPDDSIPVHDRSANSSSFFDSEFNERKILISFRSTYDDKGEPDYNVGVDFDEWESAGTKKIFAISGYILNALEFGTPLVIDEFDARFHPILTEKIVGIFNSKRTNPNNAQLIFVTHDASLLNRAELRRDQICLVDKDKYGVSTIRTLIEYKGVRKDASYEKEYLQGKYGAIPYFSTIDQIIASFVEYGKTNSKQGRS